MMATKKRIWIDLDGTVADYFEAHEQALLANPKQPYPQSQYGFFMKLKPIEDAIWAYFILSKHFNVGFLTRPSFQNLNCYSEKAHWVLNNFGNSALENTIFAGDKSLIRGDYLIDDMTNNGQPEFEGEFIQFGQGKFEDWQDVVLYILKKEGKSII